LGQATEPSEHPDAAGGTKVELVPERPYAEHTARLRALGFFLSLRFSRLLRMIRVWPAAAEPSDGKFTLRAQALRPLEYTFIRTRLFGSLFALEGFNYIFRGGLLPRHRLGRTYLVDGEPGTGKSIFALHMMADMARRGQLAIYASLDEPVEAIVDRLVAFDLLDFERYEVIEATDKSVLSDDVAEVAGTGHQPDSHALKGSES